MTIKPLDELEFKAGGMTIRIQRRSAIHSHPAAYMAKSRIYIGIPNGLDPRNEAPDVAWQGKSDPRAREYGKLHKHLAGEVIEQIYEAVGRGLLPQVSVAAEGKLRFAWTAGCSCGCSPATIFEAAPIRLDGMNADVFVDVDPVTNS